MEGLRLFQSSHTFKESEFTGPIAIFEIIEKLVSEQLRDNLYGEEESFAAGEPAIFGHG